MKMFLASLLFLVQNLAHASHLPSEGVYGSFTYYCGFELIRDLRNDVDIILTYVDNPAYSGQVRCTAVGVSELYRYNSKRKHFVKESPTLICIIKASGSNELHQVCYRKKDGVADTIENSVRYYKYR